MRLLTEPEIIPPPADFLYARIGSRLRKLQQRSGPGRQLNLPRQLRREYRWVYLRLAAHLRKRLLPIFEYQELRLLVLALRYLATGEDQALAELLGQSLLHRRLQRELLKLRQVAETVAALEKMLAADYPVFSGLTRCYLQKGPGGLEEQLLGGYLQLALPVSRSVPVRDLLVYQLDTRNLLALYKHLQWQLPQAPALSIGGKIPLVALARCWQQRDLVALQLLAQKRSGLQQDPLPTGIEDLLEQGLMKQLRIRAREPLRIEVIIYFLWCCRQFARIKGFDTDVQQPEEESL